MFHKLELELRLAESQLCVLLMKHCTPCPSKDRQDFLLILRLNSIPLCVCVCVCVCVYTYTHTYIHTNIYTHSLTCGNL